jgi:hypothetical protein
MHDRLRQAVILAGLLLPALTFAQDSMSIPPTTIVEQTGVEVRGDFYVAPTRVVLEMKPGKTRMVELELTSREGEPQTYSIDVEDFSITDDGSDIVKFYGKDVGPFSAKSWLQTAEKTISLRHGERAFMSVRVTVPADASPGDHYAALLFERLTDSSNTRIGALFLITVEGDLLHKGDLDFFQTSAPVYWSLPSQFSLQYKNTGTVHLTPTGRIDFRNIFGMTVDNIDIKDWYVVRHSVRRRDIVWRPTFALGYYTATLILQSPHQDEVKQTLSFWIIPALPTLLIVFTIFIVSFSVQAWIGRFGAKKKKRK